MSCLQNQTKPKAGSALQMGRANTLHPDSVCPPPASSARLLPPTLSAPLPGGEVSPGPHLAQPPSSSPTPQGCDSGTSPVFAVSPRISSGDWAHIIYLQHTNNLNTECCSSLTTASIKAFQKVLLCSQWAEGSMCVRTRLAQTEQEGRTVGLGVPDRNENP